MKVWDKERRRRGQAALEAAILIPAALFLVITILDVGHCIMLSADLQAAADSAARAIESSQGADVSSSKAVEEACKAYPGFRGSVTAAVSHTEHSVEPISHRLYDPAHGTYKTRPSHVGLDRYVVSLTYTGKWSSPVMSAISAASGASGRFTISSKATATIDKTLGEW